MSRCVDSFRLFHGLVSSGLPDEDAEMAAISSISAVESGLVDRAVSEVPLIGVTEDYTDCVGAIRETDTVHAVLSSVS